MKRYIISLTLLLAFIFFGCSSKTVSIPVVVKPDYISVDKAKQIRKIKINQFKNDNVNLRQKVISEMKYVNNIVPGYFKINPLNYNSIMNGEIIKKTNSATYYKRLKMPNQKGPACQIELYKCTSISGNIMCQPSIEKVLSVKDFQNIVKKAYKKGEYIYFNNRLYKYVKKCKPTSVRVKCEIKDYYINALIIIKNRKNQILFAKSYKNTERKDPCKDIEYYQGIKEFFVDDNYNTISKMTDKIAENIVSDIAPHIVYAKMKLEDDVDVKMDSKDKDLFEKALDEDTPLYQKLQILQQLNIKYPKNCVIKYNLAVFKMLNKDYNKAKDIFEYLNNYCKNDDLKKEVSVGLYYLKKLY